MLACNLPARKTAADTPISELSVRNAGYLRDTKDGKVDPLSVIGFSNTIFGATASRRSVIRLGYSACC